MAQAFQSTATLNTRKKLLMNSEAPFPALATPRLHLRAIQPTDAEDVFAFKSDRAVMDFYGDEPHQSLEETQTLIRELAEAYIKRDAIHWGITRLHDDHVIGSCTLFLHAPHYAEIGYELHPAYWRQGLMTEALTAIVTYGFTDLGLQRIEAAMDGRNVPSRQLLLKLGFSYEGNLRQRFFFGNEFLDAHYFGMLRSEWPPTR